MFSVIRMVFMFSGLQESFSAGRTATLTHPWYLLDFQTHRWCSLRLALHFAAQSLPKGTLEDPLANIGCPSSVLLCLLLFLRFLPPLWTWPLHRQCSETAVFFLGGGSISLHCTLKTALRKEPSPNRGLQLCFPVLGLLLPCKFPSLMVVSCTSLSVLMGMRHSHWITSRGQGLMETCWRPLKLLKDAINKFGACAKAQPRSNSCIITCSRFCSLTYIPSLIRGMWAKT